MTHLVTFADFQVEASDDWQDITDVLDSPDYPFTLAKENGVGALQFSAALYRRGPRPSPTKDELLSMAIELGQNRGLYEA